ncbi:MAG: sulfurtransferase TusA family protein, partial [Ruthenibacterium sp.]
MKTVDARGRACPEPVILTAQALPEAPEGLTVLVDHVCA